MNTTPEEQQSEIRIPDWIINVIGRQQLELEILRQQLAAIQAQSETKLDPDATNTST